MVNSYRRWTFSRINRRAAAITNKINVIAVKSNQISVVIEDRRKLPKNNRMQIVMTLPVGDISRKALNREREKVVMVAMMILRIEKKAASVPEEKSV